MGATQSSEGEVDVTSGFPRLDGPASQEYEYIAGTNLPVDGWLQPCTSCATTTARTVTNENLECVYMCRRCSHAAGLSSTSDERRWEVIESSPSPIEAVTTTSGEGIEDLITYNDDISLGISDTVHDDYESHIQSVDMLCRAVVGEMLIDSPQDSREPGREEKATGKETPRGVVDGADIWSDLDNSSDENSSGSSPRRAKCKDAQRKPPLTATSKTSEVDGPAGRNVGKSKKGGWLFSLADTLYPHDIFRWNCQTSALLL